MKKEEKVFRSRISVWLFGLVVAVPLNVSIHLFQHKAYLALLIVGVPVLLCLFIITGIRYVILEGKLYLKMWFISNGSVNIAEILSVKRSYNLLSSPAASLKRLRISFKQTAKYPYMLISPVREQEFIAALKTFNPNIKVILPDKKKLIDITTQQFGQTETQISERPANNWRSLILIAIAIVTTVAVTVFIYLAYKEPEVEFGSNALKMKGIYKEPEIEFGLDVFKVKGIYGVNIPFEQISKTDTITWREMPVISIRTNGISIFNIHRGNFKTHTGDKVHLSVQRGVNPVIRIVKHDGSVYYINRNNPDETRQIYNQLKIEH